MVAFKIWAQCSVRSNLCAYKYARPTDLSRRVFAAETAEREREKLQGPAQGPSSMLGCDERDWTPIEHLFDTGRWASQRLLIMIAKLFSYSPII